MNLPLNAFPNWGNAVTGLSDFLSWWRSELRTLVPAAWSTAARGLSQRRVVIADGDEWRLGFAGSEEWISLDMSEADTDLRARIARLDPRAQNQRVDVVIPMRDGFVRNIHLPPAAEPRLRQVVGFQIDRLSPLRAKDVHFDCRKLSENDDGTIAVTVGIAPAATLRTYTQRLASLGLSPSRFALSGTEFGFAPVDNRLVPQERLQLILGATALAFWLATLVLTPWLRDSELSSLSAEVASLRAPAAAAASARDQLLKMQGTLVAAEDEAARPDTLDTLRFLTGLLPDDVQLSDLVIVDGDLRLAGTARDARRIVTLLERSRRFRGAHLVGPLVRDANGRVTYQIEAKAAMTTGRTP